MYILLEVNAWTSETAIVCYMQIEIVYVTRLSHKINWIFKMFTYESCYFQQESTWTEMSS